MPPRPEAIRQGIETGRATSAVPRTANEHSHEIGFSCIDQIFVRNFGEWANGEFFSPNRDAGFLIEATDRLKPGDPVWYIEGTRGEDMSHGFKHDKAVRGLRGDDSLIGMDGDDLLVGDRFDSETEGDSGTPDGNKGDDTCQPGSDDRIEEAATEGMDTVPVLGLSCYTVQADRHGDRGRCERRRPDRPVHRRGGRDRDDGERLRALTTMRRGRRRERSRRSFACVRTASDRSPDRRSPRRRHSAGGPTCRAARRSPHGHRR